MRVLLSSPRFIITMGPIIHTTRLCLSKSISQTSVKQEMGLQKPPSNKPKAQQPNANPKNDENDGGDCFVAPNHNMTPIITTPVSSADSLCYETWLWDHPSALEEFDLIMRDCLGTRLAVFLDYDGTLSPIVDDPDRAIMSDEMRTAVREVAKYFPTAIISGRSRDKVKEFVQLNNIFYAGSHGMDIMAPAMPLKSSDDNNSMVNKGTEVHYQPAEKFLPKIREILKLLEEQTKRIIGSKVEDNRFCISVHYRRVRNEDLGELIEIVESVLESYPDFHRTNGKMVMEIRPSIKWDKGSALKYLLSTLGLLNNRDVLPVYIGDDRTDEDAFQVIRDIGRGLPIIVSSTPKETKAMYSLQDPSEVLAFLSRLARLKKISSAK